MKPNSSSYLRPGSLLEDEGKPQTFLRAKLWFTLWSYGVEFQIKNPD